MRMHGLCKNAVKWPEAGKAAGSRRDSFCLTSLCPFGDWLLPAMVEVGVE